MASIKVTLEKPLVTSCVSGFNVQQFYVLLTQRIYVFCMVMRKNRDFPYILIGFCYRYGMCLLLGTDWIFIYNSGYSLR